MAQSLLSRIGKSQDVLLPALSPIINKIRTKIDRQGSASTSIIPSHNLKAGAKGEWYVRPQDVSCDLMPGVRSIYTSVCTRQWELALGHGIRGIRFRIYEDYHNSDG